MTLRPRRGPLARATRSNLDELRRHATHLIAWQHDAEAGIYRWEHPWTVLGHLPMFEDKVVERIVEFQRRARRRLQSHPEWARIRDGLELAWLQEHDHAAYREELRRREARQLRQEVADLRREVQEAKEKQP